jgi:hypothetical protein
MAGYLTGKRHFGRQVVVAIDGKVLRGTVCDEKPGLHLLAAYLPEEGLVLMEMQVESHENEIPVAPKVLQCIDLRGKVMHYIPKERFPYKLWLLGAISSGLPKAINPRLKKIFVCGLSQMLK